MATDRFDAELQRSAHARPAAITEAMVDTADTLPLAWAAVQDTFGDQARPEHALALLAIVMQRAGGAGR